MAVPVLAGAAVLNQDTLVDSLVDMIDGLRDELHPAFGVRAYRVYRVLRTWSGRTAGEGRPTDEGAELRPQPRVRQWDGFQWIQAACGVRELGDVRLTEISLSYTEPQLTGQPLPPNREIYYAIGEAHGQESELRLWAMAAPPFIDRERDMGWVANLRRAEGSPAWAP